jgi:hypothetical protein
MELIEFVEQLPEEVKALIGHGLQLAETEAKGLRKKLEKAGYCLEEVDANLDLLKGKDDEPGLLQLFDVKEPGDPADPSQIGMEMPERDYRTHALTTEGVSELVSGIGADLSPAAAVAVLNLLEEGEREREDGFRESVLKVIRAARAPIAKRVGNLSVADGGDNG